MRKASRDLKHLLIVQPSARVANIICYLHGSMIDLRRAVQHPSRAKLPPEIIAHTPYLENSDFAIRLVGGAQILRRLVSTARRARCLPNLFLVGTMIAQGARACIGKVARRAPSAVAACAAAIQRKFADGTTQAHGASFIRLMLSCWALRAHTIHLEAIHTEVSFIAKATALALRNQAING